MPVLKVRDPNTGAYVPLLGGAANDHGALAGLGDDDHPQYVKDTGDTMSGTLTLLNAPDISTVSSPIEISNDLYPGIMLKKRSAPVDQKIYKLYISGPSGNPSNEMVIGLYKDDGVTLWRAWRFHSAGANVNYAMEIPGDLWFNDPVAAGGEERLIGLGNFTGAGIGIGVMRKTDRTLSPISIGEPAYSMQAATRNYVDQGSKAVLTANSAAGWVDFGSVYAGLYVTKTGPLVSIDCTFKRSSDLAMTVNTAYTLAVVPVGYRPDHQILAAGILATAGGATVPALCRFDVLTDGTLTMRPTVAGTITSAGYVGVNITYRQGN